MEMILLESFRLLNFDIVFIVIADKNVAIARTTKIVCADSYCVPMMDSTNLGDTINTATKGAIRLMPILALSDDKSVPDSEEAGMAMYASAEPRPPVAAMLTINAT